MSVPPSRQPDGQPASRRPSPVWLVLVLALPVLVVGAMTFSRFDGLYGQDPFAYYDYAVGPLRTAMQSLQLPPPFTWPPGYPLLIALASFMVGVTPRAGQLVSLLTGALTPIFTALLAYEVWSKSSEPSEHASRFMAHALPLLAGLLVALTGQLWQSSVVVMSDTTGLAAVTLGAWALACYGRREGPRAVIWLMLTAAAVAYALLTRWAYALVAVPFTVYALLLLARRDRSVAIRHGLAAAVVALIVMTPVLAPAIRSFTTTGGELPFAVDLQVYSWNPLNAFRREFVTADGLLSYSWPNGLWYGLAPAHRFYFTPLLAPLLILGLWAVIRRHAAAPLFLLVGWAAAIFIFHAGAPWQNFRFNLAHLPPLAILAAIGVELIALRLAGIKRVMVRRLALAALALYLLAGMALMARGGRALTRSFVDRKDHDLALVRQVEEQTPPDAQVLAFGLTLTLQHYAGRTTYELYYQDETSLAALLAADRPVYLLLDVTNAEDQWMGLPPEENYRWLQEHANLVKVADLPPLTLFEARDAP